MISPQLAHKAHQFCILKDHNFPSKYSNCSARGFLDYATKMTDDRQANYKDHQVHRTKHEQISQFSTATENTILHWHTKKWRLHKSLLFLLFFFFHGLAKLDVLTYVQRFIIYSTVNSVMRDTNNWDHVQIATSLIQTLPNVNLVTFALFYTCLGYSQKRACLSRSLHGTDDS